MNSVELPKLDKLVKVSVYHLELVSRFCPYTEDEDVACIVIPMENCISYPDQVIHVSMNLSRLPWLEKPFRE